MKLLSELEAKLVSKQKAKLQALESNEYVSIERGVTVSLLKPSSTELFLSAIASDLLQTLEIIENELDKSTGIFDIEVKGILSSIGLIGSNQPRLGRLVITGRLESAEQEESAFKLLEEAGRRSVLLNSLKDELEITIKTLY